MPEDKGLTRSEREEKVLQFWKQNKIFEKSLEKKAPKGDFIFYEGPPTANGKPGLHHIPARAFKDAIPRYKTMQGFRVPRQAGWDTHGLAVELEVEKQLGFKNKKDIENFGIAEFNKRCKESVGQYIDIWKNFTERMGYWVNFNGAYFTYNNSYIESVWKVIHHVEKRKLLYKDYKVVPWCSRCGTGLSSHELAQGYKDVKDLSLFVKFPIIGFPKAYFVAWTTTPWTLPGNLALAVGENIIYVEAKVGEEILVLAKEKLALIKEPYEIVAEHKGKEMVGMGYEPLYTFGQKSDKTHKVYTADFVTTEDGTGIVHTAVMYGQEDFELGTKMGLPKSHIVSPDGLFIDGPFKGRSVVDEVLSVDILKNLQGRGLLLGRENYTHSYPFCWRCGTRLIYYARDSWYIGMSKLRGELVKENQKINWEPEHIRDGRFGEWLKEAKDWAISRERYWGTPLPVWLSQTGEKLVVDSVETLKKYTKKSGNKYFLMRHGEAVDNAKHILDPQGDPNNHLTERGRKEIIATASKLKRWGIELIYASPFIRTRETAEVVRKELGLPGSAVVVDERLHEFNESGVEAVRQRVGNFLFDLEHLQNNKKILIISHGNPIWVAERIAYMESIENFREKVMFNTAEVRELPFIPFPHNENYELDLHKPYIDEVVLEKDGKEYKRTKEVMDVWLDSGSMPFATDSKYPADFISEAIDQTRGWFYTLHAVGVLMEKGRAFQNVVCLGHILDSEGKKMSKSVGNVIDPFSAIEKYGVDTLRLWMYSINQPGEPKNFDEKTVEEVNKRIFNLLDNVYAFYELYRDKDIESNTRPNSKNILDKWVLAKLDELINLSTSKLDNYRLLEPVRGLRDFIEDLSTWYLRRSRDRLKAGDVEARKTLYFVLKTLAKLFAPFAPFAAEDLYQKLRLAKDLESVHLEAWPTKTSSFSALYPAWLGSDATKKPEVLVEMESVRKVVSLALEARSKSNIKIRQPLAKLEVKNWKLKRYEEILKDEINVKAIVENPKLDTEVKLDTNLAPELIAEGEMRDAVRNIQEMRKEKRLKPKDIMQFVVPDGEKELFKKFGEEIKKATNIDFFL